MLALLLRRVPLKGGSVSSRSACLEPVAGGQGWSPAHLHLSPWMELDQAVRTKSDCCQLITGPHWVSLSLSICNGENDSLGSRPLRTSGGHQARGGDGLQGRLEPGRAFVPASDLSCEIALCPRLSVHPALVEHCLCTSPSPELAKDRCSLPGPSGAADLTEVVTG